VPRTIDRDEVVRLTVAGAQVVEVLAREEYEWAHLPGARNLPLKTLDSYSAGTALDRDHPIVVYCNDFL
jgi:rhodanese-related sulfurtransferase